MANRLPPSQRPERQGAPDPGPSGAPGLQRWVLNHVPHWQSFYREARRRGWPADIIVSATPNDDRVDVPPDHFAPIPRVNRGTITSRVTTLRGSFDRPPGPGLFYVLASKSTGRLKGSFVGMLSVPSDDAELPDLGLIDLTPPVPPERLS